MSKNESAVGTDYCCIPLAAAPLSEGHAIDLARGFKALSDPVRLRLLSLIASFPGGEACVCNLTEAFDLTGPTISHHLRVLRETGLVTSERRGTWIYYQVEPDRLAALSSLLQVPARTDPVAVCG
ncbi:MAG TPA: metalloregulator ArsR/SmtB family transcription factor [Actinopolymorphaceae bacterium]|nr:metalloregulator ArsR/SmtB family transcription factor [Actinopolymorphaceae bacterium]